MEGNRIHLKLDGNAAASIDQYWEYKRIAGDVDGEVLMSPEEYEQYKKRVIPQRMKNRLYTSWVAPNGMDCKCVGPETLCFCNHRYIQHKTDFKSIPEARPILVPCKVNGCKCRSYEYVPKNGSQPIRCQCKHYSDDHSEAASHKCLKGCGCKKFRSSYTCGCGEPTHAHKMIIETKEERLARGHPVGQDVPYAAMGGVTGFSSLMDGYMRLNDSGAGCLSLEELERPIGLDDHPFLRAHAGMANLSLQEGRGGGAGPVVQTRPTTEEEDMAYFERRYQERLRAEKMQARQARIPASRQEAPPTRSPRAARRNGPSKSPIPHSGKAPVGKVPSQARGLPSRGK